MGYGNLRGVEALEKRAEAKLIELLGEEYAQKRYVLAISGGLDSMVLLEIFSRLIPHRQLTVVHFNHHVRGRAAESDAQFVQMKAAGKGLAFTLGEAKPSDGKSETSLRQARLAFLQRCRQDNTADWIVTAHHANDQLETFFMRLIRGTGVLGLRGILPKRGSFLRPFLGFTRQELELYTEEKEIHYRLDHTNEQLTCFRNRIRHQLVPVIQELAEEYGGIQHFLARFEQTQQELCKVVADLQKKHEEHFHALCIQTPYWVCLPVTAFNQLEEEAKKGLIQQIYQRLQIPRITRAQVEEILSAIAERTRSFSAAYDLRINQSCDRLFFQTKEQASALHKPLQLHQQGDEVQCPPLGLKLRLDPDLYKQCEIRFFQPGDCMGNHKLKELFLKDRIPKWERRLVPLLAKRNSHKVLWYFPQSADGIEVNKVSFPFSFLAN